MLRRKIEEKLISWKKDNDRLPLLIAGARQTGKTTSVLDFANKNYKCVYDINFYEHPEFESIFSSSLDPNTILMNLSVTFPEKRRVDGSTLIFLDEIQLSASARTAMKFLSHDSRFDVIASGSLLGININIKESFPVGYVKIIDMLPLDFEEFLWAMNISEDVIDYLHDCFSKREAVSESIHKAMLSYFSAYMIVGGMPAAVRSWAERRDYAEVLAIQRDIIAGYKRDVVIYAEDSEKPKILRAFDSIPSQLAKDNKKFQYSKIEKGARSKNYSPSLLWLRDAGIISFCNNLSLLDFPLMGFAIDDEFKVYMTDTGLLLSMYESGTAKKILEGEIGLYKGALFENLIAQALKASGFPLLYFSPSDSLEIDFVINYESEITLIEVKSGENKRSKSLNAVLQNSRYKARKAIRLSRNNVGQAEGIISIPLYMVMFLHPDDEISFDLPSPELLFSELPK